MDLEDVTLRELGERKLTDMIAAVLGKARLDILPYPEDAVAVVLGDKILVLEVDSFVASTDMPPQMSYYQAGYKTAVMNISDLAAKGATPYYLLTSLCLPPDTLAKDVVELMNGVKDAAEEYGVEVLGGDVNRSEGLVINGFAVGLIERRKIMFRKGCLPGDLLAVTGDFGLTSAALKILLDNADASEDFRKRAFEAFFKPKARVREGHELADTGAITASIDSSDGLLESLRELIRVNGFGFIIEELPIAEGVKEFAEENNIPVEDLVLRGGEEFELVVTVNHEELDIAQEAINRVGGSLRVIGKVILDSKILLKKGDETVEVEGGGYEHFRG